MADVLFFVGVWCVAARSAHVFVGAMPSARTRAPKRCRGQAKAKPRFTTSTAWKGPLSAHCLSVAVCTLPRVATQRLTVSVGAGPPFDLRVAPGAHHDGARVRLAAVEAVRDALVGHVKEACTLISLASEEERAAVAAFTAPLV